MKYKDVVQFEPIVDIIQLRSSSKKNVAKTLIQTYVISDHMKVNFNKEIIPNISYLKSSPNQKGVLIIGNYGTGKSHLMSVIGGIAENPELLEFLQEKDLHKGLDGIAGKYIVIRSEIGDSTMTLRNIIIQEIEKKLKDLKIDFKFPPQDKIVNHKDAFEEMMGLFEEKYPNQGLMLIIDEMLDYLRSGTEQEMVRNFSFLREIGEICGNTNFKFIAGLQEALFDNKKFAFVSNELNRVKDRFREVKIAREDVEFVVSHRILKKSTEQKKKIQDYLAEFKPYYPVLNDHYEQFVDLFPIHPSYIQVFQNITIIEKREILKTLSEAMTERLNEEIPLDFPGLITFDSYYDKLEHLSSNADVNKLLKVSNRLLFLIQNNMSKKVYIPNSLRIIRGLSVYRLAVISLDAQIGLTTEKIRDELLIFPKGSPINTSEFLATHIKSLLEEIKTTVTGQFIGFNEDNQQYFLDLQKDVDYEQKIADYIPMVSLDFFDNYFYEILKILLEQQDETYVSGFRIWEYELIWTEHKAGRLGYLFFGAPNDRSTAHPPRDFYIYFLHIFNENRSTPEVKDDEIFLTFKDLPNEILLNLKHYASCIELANHSDQDTRKNFEIIRKKDEKKLIEWFKLNFSRYMKIYYKGKEELINKFLVNENNFKNIIDLIASELFSGYFDAKYPDYPFFEKIISMKNIRKACTDAVNSLVGSVQTDSAKNILHGLELLKNTGFTFEESRYSQWIIKEITKKETDKVLRRDELIQNLNDIELTREYLLEPELLAVLITGLACNGNVVIALPSKKIDVSNLNDLKARFDDLYQFKHLERPKGFDWSLIRKLFVILGIFPGFATEEKINEGIKELNIKAESYSNQFVVLKEKIQKHTPIVFNQPIFLEDEKSKIIQILEKGVILFDKLVTITDKGRLMQLKLTENELNEIKECLEFGEINVNINSILDKIQPLTIYLFQVESIFPDTASILTSILSLKKEFIVHFTSPKTRLDETTNLDYLRRLTDLKNGIISEYQIEHKKARLDKKQDEKLKKIKNGQKIKVLGKIRQISLMPGDELENYTQKLTFLKPCFQLAPSDIANSPICPHCNYYPLKESYQKSVDIMVEELSQELDQIYQNWIDAIRRHLEDPSAKSSIELLNKTEKKAVDNFLENNDFPKDTDTLKEFINAVNKVIKGLEKIIISIDEIVNALKEGGYPCTTDELIDRFTKFITSKVTNGKEKSRFVM